MRNQNLRCPLLANSGIDLDSASSCLSDGKIWMKCSMLPQPIGLLNLMLFVLFVCFCWGLFSCFCFGLGVFGTSSIQGR